MEEVRSFQQVADSQIMSTQRDKVLDGLLAMDKVILVDEIDVLQPLCSRPAIPLLPVPALNLLTPKA